MINNYIKSCFIELIKYGKIKSFFYRLKKIKKKLLKYLKIYFKKNVCIYIIKIKIRKGDNCLIGECGIINNFTFNLLK